MRPILFAFTLSLMIVLASYGGDASSRHRTNFPTAHAAVRGQAARSQPFVASKWSHKYHEASCQWAKKITAGNLVGCESREDATRDGRQPCGACRP